MRLMGKNVVKFISANKKILSKINDKYELLFENKGMCVKSSEDVSGREFLEHVLTTIFQSKMFIDSFKDYKFIEIGVENAKINDFNSIKSIKRFIKNNDQYWCIIDNDEFIQEPYGVELPNEEPN